MRRPAPPPQLSSTRVPSVARKGALRAPGRRGLRPYKTLLSRRRVPPVARAGFNRVIRVTARVQIVTVLAMMR